MSLFSKGDRVVSLPSQDTDPTARAEALAEKRAAYTFNQDYHGITWATQVPKNEAFGLLNTPAYYAIVAENLVELHRAKRKAAEALGGQVSLKGSALPARHAASIEEYDAFFTDALRPPGGPWPASSKHWREDWYFAWQRVAGATPTLIKRSDRSLLSRFPITEAIYGAAVGGVDTLEAAFDEGRLYHVDFPLLEGIENGEYPPPEGKDRGERAVVEKFAWSPIAMFAVLPGEGGARSRFVPVGIQCTPKPVDGARIWTPADGVRWSMAKNIVQSADMYMHETAHHTAAGHMVVESVVLMTHRELAPNHPLYVLLEPHFEYTLATNEVARESFLKPGTHTDRLAAGTLDGSLDLVVAQIAAIELDKFNPEAEVAGRGMADADALPFYPYRDDAMLVMRAIRAWVDGYLRLYYKDDGDVAGDGEVKAWLDAIRDPEGGQIRGVPDVDTIDGLVHIVSNILWLITGFHNSINYSGWEFAGYPPNMSTATFAPAPTLDVEPTEADFLASLPPFDYAWEVLEVMYSLIKTDANRLGDYDEGFLVKHSHFEDSRVGPLIDAFNKALEEARAEIDRRNADTDARPAPYNHVLPGYITQSVHA